MKQLLPSVVVIHQLDQNSSFLVLLFICCIQFFKFLQFFFRSSASRCFILYPILRFLSCMALYFLLNFSAHLSNANLSPWTPEYSYAPTQPAPDPRVLVEHFPPPHVGFLFSLSLFVIHMLLEFLFCCPEDQYEIEIPNQFLISTYSSFPFICSHE